MFSVLKHLYGAFDIRSEVNEIFIHRIIDAFAFGLVGVFVPIYLFNIGYSLNDVFLYLALTFLFYSIFAGPALKLAEKIGIKHTVTLSQVMLVALFLLLRQVQSPVIPVFFLAAFTGLIKMLYWMPLNTDFAVATHPGHTGKETAMLHMFPQIAAIAAPLIGGVLITYLGFEMLFLVGAVLILASVWPLFITKERFEAIRMKKTDVFSKRNFPLFNIFLANGFFFAAYLLWPFYVYITVPDYVFTGIITALVGLSTALVIYFVGRFEDRIGVRPILRIGGAANFVLWISVLFVDSRLGLGVLSFFFGIVSGFILVPTLDFAVKIAKNRKSAAEVMLLRELPLGFGRFALLFLPVFLPDGIKFQAVFVLAAVASLYFFLTDDIEKIW